VSSREGKKIKCHIRNHIYKVVSYKEFSHLISAFLDMNLCLHRFRKKNVKENHYLQNDVFLLHDLHGDMPLLPNSLLVLLASAFLATTALCIGRINMYFYNKCR
jgi:hypothetical protein